ncbi:MAG: hypothetical protein IK100_00805 [Muribaculaceae bacterium]|nr:hypothetical protein [Muribaculaceae bacterium]MBR5117166.1 hypothetical protein [Muribaculaceae bacterium]
MTRRTKNIIKITLGLITLFVVAVALIMTWTNPSKEDHKKVLAQVVNKYDVNKLNLTEAERDQYINYVCNGSGVDILRKEVAPRFMVEDNTLWSVGYIYTKDDNGAFLYKKKVTTGVFNKVSIVDEQELMQAILEAHRKNEQRTAEAGKQQAAQ